MNVLTEKYGSLVLKIFKTAASCQKYDLIILFEDNNNGISN